MSAPSARSSSTSRSASPGGGGRVHLVAAAVAELRGALGGLAERAVEGAGVLGGVAHDRHVREAVGVQPPADRPDHAVHHAAGGDHVGAGPGVDHGLPAEQLQRGVVVHVDPAGRLVRAAPQWPWSVYSQKQTSVITSSSGAACLASRTAWAMMPESLMASLPTASLCVGNAEQHHAAQPQLGRLADLVGQHVERQLEVAGHGGDLLPHVPCPAGRTAAGSGWPAKAGVSRTRLRTAGW